MGENASISNSVTNKDNVIYYIYNTEEEKSLAEQLFAAENLYIQQKYNAADEIYISLLEKSDVANINHGYLYAHGFGVPQNTEKASEYYLKAYEMGNALGLKNYIAINIQHPVSYKATLEALEYGFNHDDETAISFLSVCSYGNLQNVSKEQLKIIAEDFLRLSNEDQVETLKSMKMNTTFEIVAIDNKELPVNGEFVSYQKIDVKWGKRTVIDYITQKDENANEVIIPVNSYDKTTTYCKTASSFYMAEYFEQDLFYTM